MKSSLWEFSENLVTVYQGEGFLFSPSRWKGPPAERKGAFLILPSGLRVHLNIFQYLTCLNIITNLDIIAQAAQEKEFENQAFKAYLRSHESSGIDRLVQELDASITPQIDCTSCGNCCRSLMINITTDEVTRLATHLERPETDVREQYIETGFNTDDMVMNTIPCHFLVAKRCSIYEHRFAGCRDFPGLDQPEFTSRLFAMLMHYGRCLIIYNVLEEMKRRLKFTL